MARWLKGVALLVGIACLFAAARIAEPVYNIAPQTLRMLIHDSQLVVWARVERVEREPGDFVFATASLKVDQVLMGSAPTAALLSVSFYDSFLCDPPPRYAVGEQVLAFLSRGLEGSAVSWNTIGLHFGTKYPTPEAFEVYATRLAEYLEMGEPPAWTATKHRVSQQVTERALVHQSLLAEWLTRLIESPPTLYEAYLELSRDPFWPYDVSAITLDALDASQLQRVIAVIGSGDTQQRKVLWLLRYLKRLPAERLITPVLSELKALSIGLHGDSLQQRMRTALALTLALPESSQNASQRQALESFLKEHAEAAVSAELEAKLRELVAAVDQP